MSGHRSKICILSEFVRKDKSNDDDEMPTSSQFFSPTLDSNKVNENNTVKRFTSRDPQILNIDSVDLISCTQKDLKVLASNVSYLCVDKINYWFCVYLVKALRQLLMY